MIGSLDRSETTNLSFLYVDQNRMLVEDESSIVERVATEHERTKRCKRADVAVRRLSLFLFVKNQIIIRDERVIDEVSSPIFSISTSREAARFISRRGAGAGAGGGEEKQ